MVMTVVKLTDRLRATTSDIDGRTAGAGIFRRNRSVRDIGRSGNVRPATSGPFPRDRCSTKS
jgi:hypothetical protein